MGLVKGEYDAKQGGFVPGGASLHNAHDGPRPGPRLARRRRGGHARAEVPRATRSRSCSRAAIRSIPPPMPWPPRARQGLRRRLGRLHQSLPSRPRPSPKRRGRSHETRLPEGPVARRHARPRQPRPLHRRRRLRHLAHDAARARELGCGGPPAPRRVREPGVRQRAARVRLPGGAGEGPGRRPAAARLRVAGWLGLPLPRRAGAARARRHRSGELLPRSAHVPGRGGRHDGPARSHPRPHGGLGHRPGRRGRRHHGRRADGSRAGGSRRCHPPPHAGERRLLPQAHSGRARQGLRVREREGRQRARSRRRDARRAGRRLGRRQGPPAPRLPRERAVVRQSRMRASTRPSACTTSSRTRRRRAS